MAYSALKGTAMIQKTPQSVQDPAASRGWLGHPRGLSTLFFTEMWERFSYYGIRPLLVLFMTAALLDGGFGFPRSEAAAIVGIYAACVYLSSLPGGWMADRDGMRDSPSSTWVSTSARCSRRWSPVFWEKRSAGTTASAQPESEWC